MIEPALVTSCGVTLAVRRLGGGPRLIGVHGGPGLDGRSLLPLANRLADAFEVWLPDLPGHGATPGGRPPGLTAVEERLGRWLRSLPGTTAALLGHSLGAYLLRELSRRGALPALPLVLVSPPAPGPAAGARTRTSVPGSRASGAGDRAAALRAHLARECGGVVPRELAVAVDATAHHTSLLRNLERRLAGPVRPLAQRAPLLVLCGEEDATTPPDHAIRIAAASPGARLELLEGCGHYPWVQQPDQVAELVGRFLAETVTRAGER